MNVLAGALVDEPETVGCDCWCDCYARVEGETTLRCEDCERGEHVTDDEGGEG